MFPPPQIIRSEVFAEVPARLRKSGTPAERLAAGKSATPAGCFLEGPAFRLYITDSGSGCILKAKVPVTEVASREKRLREGIPIPDTLMEKLKAVCERSGVPFLFQGS